MDIMGFDMNYKIKIWNVERKAWVDHIGSQTDLRRGLKPIEKKEMKEYLEKQPNGSYVMKSGFAFKDAGWIEIPEGALCAYDTGSTGVLFTENERINYAGFLVWQRESPNDKLASAEQYRQAEVLPFIDDEPKNVDLASGCDLDELAKEYGFRDRDIGESCLCYRESLEIFIARDKSREWDLSDYDFAESDAWIESNIEQDNINNPSHYADSAIECIDAMQAMLTPEQFVGYLRGNILKYQWRYEKKNGIEDLKKSQWYLDKLISVL